ncbi:MAG: diguanylate cyclase [Lachnospiraceae bacterium]|nr:diguanylate cyclase [Lachnospiraceae bacterium]
MSKVIMIVDDDKNNLAIQKEFLKPEYDIILATSGESALRRLARITPDLVLLDNIMPGMMGIEVLDEMQKDERLKRIPVIILTAEHDPTTEKECFIHGAADFITKPFASGVLLERIRKTLEFWELRNELEIQVFNKTREAETVVLQSIMAIANTIDAKDAYTKGHSERVAEYSAVIAKEMGWSEEEVQLLYNIALLHDIGKIGIPDSILNKPGRLTDDEFSIIKQHTVTGGEILKDIHSMQNAFIAARYHHERYDGRGYPNGLKGEEIPIYARVIAVADAYDAMTSNRVYRKKLSNKVVIDELKKGLGTQFDPKIGGIFVDILTRSEGTESDNSEEKEERMPEILNKQKFIDEFQTTHDYISGLYHKEYGMELIGQIPAKEDYTYCLIDIGNFRRLNKVYGRVQGDYVLEVVAGIISRNLKEDDFAYRVCGGSFGVCLLRQSEKEEILEYVNKVVEDFEKTKKKISVMEFCNIYIGISRTVCDGKDFEQIFSNADRALYFAKNAGENSYAFYHTAADEDVQENKGLGRLIKCLFSEEERKKGAVPGNKKLIRILDQIADFIRESNRSCSLILFELEPVRENLEEYSFGKDSMNNLELAAMEALRDSDSDIRLSSSQYLLILPESQDRNLQSFIKRVEQQYYRLDSSTRFELCSQYETGVQEEKTDSCA